MTPSTTRGRLSAGDRRALWIGAFIVVPVIAVRLVAVPFIGALERANDRFAQARELLARERALLRDAPTLPPLLAQTSAEARERSGRLFGGTDTLAASSAIAAWARSAGLAAGLGSVNVQPADVAVLSGGVRSVGVDVRASGGFAAVSRWLASLERGERALIVERLEISGGASGELAVSARIRGLMAPFASVGRRP